MAEVIEKTEEGDIKITTTKEEVVIVPLDKLERDLFDAKDRMRRRLEFFEQETEKLQAQVDAAQSRFDQAQELTQPK